MDASQDLESLRTQVAVNWLYKQLSENSMTLPPGQTVKVIIDNLSECLAFAWSVNSKNGEAAWLSGRYSPMSPDAVMDSWDEANLREYLIEVLPAVPDPKTLIESAGYTITQ